MRSFQPKCPPGHKLAIDRAELDKKPRGWLADYAARCGEPVLPERVLDSLSLSAVTRVRLMRQADLGLGFLDLTPDMRLEVITAKSANTPMQITNISGTDASLQVDLTGA